jgi:acetylornithine/LysW-gamma-L-lysine aminotransferase
MTEIFDASFAQVEEAILGGTTTRRGEVVIRRGAGCWLWDTDDKRYLDLTAAQGVAMVGHCHPKLSAAIAEQAHGLIACPSFVYNDTRARFAQQLRSVLPEHLAHVFLTNSGAEAMDGALKFARLTTGRAKFVAFTRAFHGRTVGALSVTHDPKYREPFHPLLETTHVPYNNLTKLEAAVDEQTAAVVVEVVQGEGGVNLGKTEFLQGVQQLCRARGALLIVDEIQTGFGRTGKWFAHQHVDLQPDILCMAKGIGGGFPMGALAYTPQVQAALFPGAHGSTFGGNPLACAAGLAALEIYHDEGLIDRSTRLGDYLRQQLSEALHDRTIVREVRGLGLMVAVELREKVGPFLKTLMETHGVLALPAGPNVLRLLPPLIISEAEIDQGVRAIAETLPTG